MDSIKSKGIAIMLAPILYFCISVLLSSLLWRALSYFFMAGFLHDSMHRYHTIIKKYALAHYLLTGIYTLFAYHIATHALYPLQHFSSPPLFSQDFLSIYVCIIACLLLLHVLSTLDSIMQKVPNVLLFLLFACSNILYYLTHKEYSAYPLMVLGAVYGIFFLLHITSKKHYIGEGDIWIIASLAVLLESFFMGEFGFIFELLCVASVFGICFIFASSWIYRIQKKDSKVSGQIPFIPFLSTSFVCVSVWHAA